MIFSFMLIHSVKCEIDEKVNFIGCGLHMKRGRWDTYFVVFFCQKRRFQGFIPEILKVIGPLVEKFFFSTRFGQPKFPEFSDFLFNLDCVSISNIREVVKFYNLGNQSFETDFRFLHIFFF